MAKKTKSYSQVQATDALEQLGRRGISAPEFVYDLLRIFAGYGDGQVRCSKKHLNLYQNQDDVDEKKEILLAKVKAMLAQKIEQTKLITFHWRII